LQQFLFFDIRSLKQLVTKFEMYYYAVSRPGRSRNYTQQPAAFATLAAARPRQSLQLRYAKHGALVLIVQVQVSQSILRNWSKLVAKPGYHAVRPVVVIVIK
jgi:hypothetical protein